MPSCGATGKRRKLSPLGWAYAECERLGLKITSDRRLILEELARHKNGLGAYTLLEHVRTKKASASPVLVYRALAFFSKAGVVRKLKCNSVYLLCTSKTQRTCGPDILLICPICHSVTTIKNREFANCITSTLLRTGHTLHEQGIQIDAICPKCSP